MSDFTLSVIMPNYNYSRFIGTALDAILNQSFKPFEVIVVDDGSTDNSVDIIKGIQKRHPQLHLVQMERNVGVIEAAGKALELARGRFLYAASADDRVLPGFFEESMALLRKYPQAGLSCCDAVLVDSRTGATTVNRLRLAKEPCYISPNELAKLIRRRHIHIWGHTVIVKRQALDETGAWIGQFKWDIDRIAHLMVAFRYGMCYIPRPLASYRVTAKCYSTSSAGQPKARREIPLHLLRLLTMPSNSDIVPLFKLSTMFYSFGLNGLRPMLRYSEYRDFLSFRLVARSLWWELHRQTAALAPFSVKQRYRSFRDEPQP
jgi:glycosyltransferase involved in cell wall biosynthesis